MNETAPPTRFPLRTRPPRAGRGTLGDTVWNAVSNVAAASLSFAVLALTARFSGAWWCGVVAFAFAASQQLYTLGNFTMQSYQASDVAQRRSFGDYVSAKAVSLAAMFFAAGLWLAAGNPGRDKTAAFLALLLYQASEAFSNAFFARYQQQGRLDVACRIRFSKTVAFSLAFAAVLAAVGNPLPALAAAAAVHAALFFVLDVPMLRAFGPLRPHRPDRTSLEILVACAPIAANSVLLMAVHNGPKFAVDATLGEEALAAYSALFMVSFGVALCADFLMNPQLVPLARAVRERDCAALRRTLAGPLLAIVVLGAAGLAAGAAVGVPVLSAVFGLDLGGTRGTLCLLLAGGVLVALYQLGQTVLVVLRRQVRGLPGMLLAVAVSFGSAGPLARRFGLRGAACAYLAAVAALAFCSVVLASLSLWTAFRRVPATGGLS